MKDMPQIKQNGNGLEVVPVNGCQNGVIANGHQNGRVDKSEQIKEQIKEQINGHNHQNGTKSPQCTCSAAATTNGEWIV
jgi:hypothetical protein